MDNLVESEAANAGPVAHVAANAVAKIPLITRVDISFAQDVVSASCSVCFSLVTVALARVSRRRCATTDPPQDDVILSRPLVLARRSLAPRVGVSGREDVDVVIACARIVSRGRSRRVVATR